MRVLVVDDHQAFGHAIAHVLAAQDWVVEVTVASSGTEAHQIATKDAHDVLLVDQRLGDITGTDLVRWIGQTGTPPPAILISSEVSDATLLDAVQAGCCGVLDKSDHVDVVIESVLNASRGDIAMPPGMTSRLLPLLRTGPADPTGLSHREKEVLREVVAGHSNATIAEHMYLSVHTVRNHVATILRKLDAHSKIQAVAISRERGLLD